MGTHGVKIVVIYPRPHDEQAFEIAYLEQHVPLVEQKLKGITRLVLTKVTGSPQGKVSAYRIAEVYFSSLDDLNQCVESDAGKEIMAHAQAISSGGPPLFLICEEEAFVYW
jgi:uncharacterized protein (TIGR02118 family)